MTDLTDRMRTCAAFLLSLDKVEENSAARAAADLLIEASDVLEAEPAPLGDPMEIIEPVEPKLPGQHQTFGTWAPGTKPTQGTWIAPGGTLPLPGTGIKNSRACPQCDSRAAKRVRRVGNKLMIECPACRTQWEWQALTGKGES